MSSRSLVAAMACVAAGFLVSILFAVRDRDEPTGDAATPDFRSSEGSHFPRPGVAMEPPIDPAPALVLVEAPSKGDVPLRSAGLPPPPPDALVEVRGRVIDERTGEPVQGISLGFLSRRPRTCTARTDADGRFQTRAELTSGVVLVAHLPDPEYPLLSARWSIEPTSFVAPAPDMPGAEVEVVLKARAPERVLDVDVRLPDGLAAVGAAVSLTSGRRDGAGRFLPGARAYEDSDANGRARFALHGSEAWEGSFRVEAEHDGVFASDVLVLDPPIARTPRTLDLLPGGIVRVRTRNDEGRPVAGVSLWISTHELSDAVRGRAGDTDARGESLFTALRAGCYTVSAIHPSTGEEIRREVDLARGEQETVDFPLTLAGLRLRLSGTVVDELGTPLLGVVVRAQANGEPWIALTTREGGHFEFWGPPCDSIQFGAGGGFLDDRYEPEFCSATSGTSGVIVRRLAKLEPRSWACRIGDRATGELVSPASVTLHHGDPRGLPEAQQSFNVASGVVQLTFKQRDDMSYAVDAPGYLRENGTLADLIAANANSGILRVELDAGFERRIEVRDRVTRRGIPGTALSAEALFSAHTDEHGRAHLRADAWPASIRIKSPGYATSSWDPFAAGFPGDVIWLEPLRAVK